MNTTYTKIPLGQLDLVRTTLKAHLKSRTEATGYRYKTRTFFLGPRSGPTRAYTLKDDAYAAKIGIYEQNPRGGYRSDSFDLSYYI